MGFSFDSKTGLYILDDLNKGIGTMNFDEGMTEPQVGEWLSGEGADGKVVSVTKSTGTWGVDATGSIVLEKCEGRFNDNEVIHGSIGGSTMLKVKEPDTASGVDEVRNGEFEEGTGGWTAGNSATLASVAGGKIGNCLEITENGEANPRAQQTFSLISGKTYKLVFHVKKGTEATYSIRHKDGVSWQWTFSNEEATDSFVKKTYIFEAIGTAGGIELYQICDAVAGTTIYFDEVSLYELDEEVVVVGGKTLMVSSVMFVPAVTDGDGLLLTDYNDNKFVDVKGLINEPNIIPFRKPRKLNGLKVASLYSGKAYVYLAQ